MTLQNHETNNCCKILLNEENWRCNQNSAKIYTSLVSQKMKKQETKIFRNESNNKYGKQQLNSIRI